MQQLVDRHLHGRVPIRAVWVENGPFVTGVCGNNKGPFDPLPLRKQELSYRKQIASQLRTQYVEGIYRPKYHHHHHLFVQ